MSAINSLAGIFRGGQMPRCARAILTPFEEDVKATSGKSASVANDARVFQYFPETIQDNRGTDYQTKPIPGLSHPLYQWTAGGPREISFVAMFSRDHAMLKEDFQALQLVRQMSSSDRLDADGAATRIRTNNPQSIDPRNVDIPSAIAWLRSYTYPEFSITGNNIYGRPSPPRRLILTLPNMRINQGTPELCDDEVRCIMTQCDVVYDGFFNDGTPRMARVQLAFAEIIQYNGGVTPVGAGTMRSAALSLYRLYAPKGR